MTVKQMIEMLNEYPEDLEVNVSSNSIDEGFPLPLEDHHLTLPGQPGFGDPPRMLIIDLDADEDDDDT